MKTKLRKPAPRKPAPRSPDETALRLAQAAEAEFNARGFHGTDSNRIARRAGYAPQTFYRHYADKTAIFVAVYERWWQSESDTLAKLLRARPRPDLVKVADAMIAFHVKWRGFRRSLRHLAVEDDRVRAARTAARKAQIEAARSFMPGASDAEIYAALLVFERLCDAVAEGEFADTGFSRATARQAVIAAVAGALDRSV